MDQLLALIAAATPAEIDELAIAAGTSSHYLVYHLAKGKRNLSVELAAKLEEASLDLHRKSNGRVPALSRVDLTPTCTACPFAR